MHTYYKERDLETSLMMNYTQVDKSFSDFGKKLDSYHKLAFILYNTTYTLDQFQPAIPVSSTDSSSLPFLLSKVTCIGLFILFFRRKKTTIWFTIDHLTFRTQIYYRRITIDYVSKQYCEEHPRVELLGGKCVACGEIPIKYKTSNAGTVMVYVYVVVFISLVIATLYGFIYH